MIKRHLDELEYLVGNNSLTAMQLFTKMSQLLRLQEHDHIKEVERLKETFRTVMGETNNQADRVEQSLKQSIKQLQAEVERLKDELAKFYEVNNEQY